jgi:alkylation response protein AidB-like acyl-CoA dehydrogenase
VDPDAGDDDIFHGAHSFPYDAIDMQDNRKGGSVASNGLTAEVEAFLATNPPGRPPADLAERFAWLVDYQRRVHEAGLAVVSWPVELGGRGLGPFEAIEVAEAMGRGKAPELINFVATEVVAPALRAHSTPEQVARWLPPMASAEVVWCQLFSEPDAGSDLASLRTRAVRDGGGWRITGRKVWSTWGQFAHKGLLLARTGDTALRHKSITAMVIDMDQPEVEVRPLVTMTGVAEFAEVAFDGAWVDDRDVVGEEGGGWAVALQMLENERGPYALRRVAVLGAGLERLTERARRAALPRAARERLVDAWISMFLLERRGAIVASRLATGSPLGAEATLAKVALTDAEQTVFAATLDSLGPCGMAWAGVEPEEVELYLYSRAASIYGGSAQIQRNVLAERYLGLPVEPR